MALVMVAHADLAVRDVVDQAPRSRRIHANAVEIRGRRIAPNRSRIASMVRSVDTDVLNSAGHHASWVGRASKFRCRSTCRGRCRNLSPNQFGRQVAAFIRSGRSVLIVLHAMTRLGPHFLAWVYAIGVAGETRGQDVAPDCWPLRGVRNGDAPDDETPCQKSSSPRRRIRGDLDVDLVNVQRDSVEQRPVVPVLVLIR